MTASPNCNKPVLRPLGLILASDFDGVTAFQLSIKNEQEQLVTVKHVAEADEEITRKEVRHGIFSKRWLQLHTNG